MFVCWSFAVSLYDDTFLGNIILPCVHDGHVYIFSADMSPPPMEDDSSKTVPAPYVVLLTWVVMWICKVPQKIEVYVFVITILLVK